VRACFVKDTKRNKDDRNNSKNVSDNFVLIDEPIDSSTQEEYLSFSETIDFDNVDYEGVLTGSDKLFVTDVGRPTLKEILKYLEEINHRV